MELFAIMGIVTAFNFCILLWKFKKGRLFDFILDCFCMVCICGLFSGSQGSLIMGMVGSATISLYLMFCPIRLRSLLRAMKPKRLV